MEFKFFWVISNLYVRKIIKKGVGNRERGIKFYPDTPLLNKGDPKNKICSFIRFLRHSNSIKYFLKYESIVVLVS